MKKIVFSIFSFLFCMLSVSAQRLIRYEFLQKTQATAHWTTERSVSISIKGNGFSMIIIDGVLYGGNVPLLDTISIEGSCIAVRNGYRLLNQSDDKVKFTLIRRKNWVRLQGKFYNKSKSTYNDLKVESLL